MGGNEPLRDLANGGVQTRETLRLRAERRRLRFTRLLGSDNDAPILHVPALLCELAQKAAPDLFGRPSVQAVVEPGTDEMAQQASARGSNLVKVVEHR
jgi:hypothetical protein